MEERRVLGPREARAAEVQEKMGGVPRSQAQGTEQVRFLGWPDSREPGKEMWGLWVRAGEKGETRDQEGWSQVRPRETPQALVQLLPLRPDTLDPPHPPRRGSIPACPEPPCPSPVASPGAHSLPVTRTESKLDV